MPGQAAFGQVRTTEPAEIREQAEQQERARAAAAAAAVQRREQEGVRTVTFAEVLKDPDNVELNFDYARTLVAQGDLKGASATLERMLLNNPELAQVRLFYAIVLYRLDSLDEAERELKSIIGLPMPDSLRKEIQAYLDRISFRKKLTRYSASLSFGFSYDSNRNAAPRSGGVLFLDIPLEVPDNQREHSDKSFLTIGSMRVRHDLGFQEKHEVFGGFSFFRQDDLHLNDQNTQNYAFDAGGTYKSDWVNMT
ncbi:MAG: tetratricopeptide repeat protein, partial [Rhodospirillales bacterium]